MGPAPFSCPSFFQNTNSVPGGPKSWAQLNGKPAGHEGGKCGRVVLGWVWGRDEYLFWTGLGSPWPKALWNLSPERAVLWSLSLCPRGGSADSAKLVGSSV